MADRWVTAEELQEGDAIDLEPILKDFPCKCEDHQGLEIRAAFDYQVVVSVERETLDCVRIGIGGAGSYGVPPSYLVFVAEGE